MDTISLQYVATFETLGTEANQPDPFVVKLPRARITNGFFAQIIDDLHIVINNYGHMHDHDDGDSRSRLTAPVCVPCFPFLLHKTQH